MGQTPEEKASSLDEQFEASKERAENRPKDEPAKIPEKPKYGAGSDTTDDGDGTAW